MCTLAREYVDVWACKPAPTQSLCLRTYMDMHIPRSAAAPRPDWSDASMEKVRALLTFYSKAVQQSRPG